MRQNKVAAAFVTNRRVSLARSSACQTPSTMFISQSYGAIVTAPSISQISVICNLPPCIPATRRGAKYLSFNSATSYHCNAVLLTYLHNLPLLMLESKPFLSLLSHSTTLPLSVDHWVHLTTRHNLTSFFLLATQHPVYLSSKCTVTSQRQCRAPPLLVVADRGNGHARDA